MLSYAIKRIFAVNVPISDSGTLKLAGSRSMKIICVFRKPTRFEEKNEMYGSASRFNGLIPVLRLIPRNSL